MAFTIIVKLTWKQTMTCNKMLGVTRRVGYSSDGYMDIKEVE